MLLNVDKYKNLNDEKNIAVLSNRSYLTQLCEFEPENCTVLESGLYEYLEKSSKIEDSSRIRDFITTLVDYSYIPCQTIINKTMKDDIQRNIVKIHYSKARSFNSTTIKKLNSIKGQNVIEKLSQSPKIYTVKRSLTFDIPENQLLKEYLKELDIVINICESSFTNKNYPENLIRMKNLLRTWKLSAEIDLIGDYKSMTITNAISKDRNYRKIWISLSFLRNLDDYCSSDFNNFQKNSLSVFFMEFLGKLNSFKKTNSEESLLSFIQRPIDIKYNEFDLDSIYKINQIWLDDKKMTFDFSSDYKNLKITYLSKSNSVVNICFNKEESSKEFIQEKINQTLKKLNINFEQKIKERKIIKADYAIVDLFSNSPSISIDDVVIKISNRLLFQDFKHHEKLLDCCDASGICIDKNVTSINIDSVFFDNLLKEKYHEIFIKSVLEKISKLVDVNTMYYTLPDGLSDFDTSIIRREFNYMYEKAIPFPLSIAYVSMYQYSDYNNDIKNDDLHIIINIIDGYITLTPLISRVKKSLKNQIPGGIIWERHPTSKIELSKDLDNKYQQIKSLGKPFTIRELLNDDYLKYYDCSIENSPLNMFKDFSNSLKKYIKNRITTKIINDIKHKLNYKISGETYLILQEGVNSNITNFENTIFFENKLDEIIDEYVKYDRIISNAKGDFSYWTDFLPSLKLIANTGNGIRKELDLVKDSFIRPKFDSSIKIPCKEIFTLPKGKENYSFDLIQQEGYGNQPYSALLSSEDFPLKDDLECELELLYNYGAENPYTLYFNPINNDSINKIQATWGIRPKIKYENFVPKFPKYKEDGKIERISSLIGQVEELLDLENFYNLREESGNWVIYNEIVSKRDNLDKGYMHAGDTFFHIKSVYKGNYMSIEEIRKHFYKGPLYFQLEETDQGMRAINIVFSKDKMYGYIADKLFPLSYKLADECVSNFSLLETTNNEFINQVTNLIDNLNQMLSTQKNNYFHNALLRILAALGKDTVFWSKKDIKILVSNSYDFSVNIPTIAFAIGDLSYASQKEILDKVFQSKKNRENSFQVLSQVLWLNENNICYLATKINQKDLNSILEDLYKYIDSEYHQCSKGFDKKSCKQLIKYLELLLALFRVRQEKISLNLDLLNVNSEYNKKYSNLLESLIYLCNSNKEIRKFILKPNVKFIDAKSKNKVPPLLSSIVYYLNCDDSKSKVVISGYKNN